MLGAMPRAASAIQAEIDKIEAFLQTDAALYSSTSADGVNRTIARRDLERRLDGLYIQLGRANGTAPMFVRGRVAGLRGD